MRIPLVLLLLLFYISSHSQQKKQLQFFQTDWGSSVSWDAFCEKTKASGYDGIETWYHHIHARVGHAEGPQVNDPEAPEWQNALDRHLDIWEKVIRKRWAENDRPFTITTEFGPPTYMPTLPYTQLPVADQWKANVFIMDALKERMGVK